jgi:hypothetical protein
MREISFTFLAHNNVRLIIDDYIASDSEYVYAELNGDGFLYKGGPYMMLSENECVQLADILLARADELKEKKERKERKERKEGGRDGD